MNPNNPRTLPLRGQVHKWAASRGLHEYKLEGMPTRFCSEMAIHYTGATNKDGMVQLANDLEFLHGYPVTHQPWDFETGEGGVLTIHQRETA